MQMILFNSRRKIVYYLFTILSLLLSTPSIASVLYTYDDNGRIMSALYDNGVCVVYAYDANGNRLSQTTLPAGSANTSTWGTGTYGCFKWSS